MTAKLYGTFLLFVYYLCFIYFIYQPRTGLGFFTSFSRRFSYIYFFRLQCRCLARLLSFRFGENDRQTAHLRTAIQLWIAFFFNSVFLYVFFYLSFREVAAALQNLTSSFAIACERKCRFGFDLMY